MLTCAQIWLASPFVRSFFLREKVQGFFSIDKSQHNEVEVLFKSITIYIEQLSNGSARRIAAMKEAAKIRAAQKQVVHSNDHTLQRLHMILQPAGTGSGGSGSGSAGAASGVVDEDGLGFKGGGGGGGGGGGSDGCSRESVLTEQNAILEAVAAVQAGVAEAESKRDALLQKQVEQMNLLESRLFQYERLAWGSGNGRNNGDGDNVDVDVDVGGDVHGGGDAAKSGLLGGAMPELTPGVIRGKMTTLQVRVRASLPLPPICSCTCGSYRPLSSRCSCGAVAPNLC